MFILYYTFTAENACLSCTTHLQQRMHVYPVLPINSRECMSVLYYTFTAEKACLFCTKFFLGLETDLTPHQHCKQHCIRFSQAISDISGKNKLHLSNSMAKERKKGGGGGGKERELRSSTVKKIRQTKLQNTSTFSIPVLVVHAFWTSRTTHKKQEITGSWQHRIILTNPPPSTFLNFCLVFSTDPPTTTNVPQRVVCFHIL